MVDPTPTINRNKKQIVPTNNILPGNILHPYYIQQTYYIQKTGPVLVVTHVQQLSVAAV
jgi:hypothetical protein